MLMAENFLFNLHQFIISFLSVFYLYFTWKDLRSNTYQQLNFVSLKVLGPLLVGLCLGTYIYLLSEWGAITIVISMAFSILITLSIYDSKFAVGFFTFLLISRPWEFFKDELMMSMLRDISILAILSLIAHRLFRKKFYFVWNYATSIILFYSIWVFLSIFANGSPFWSVQLFSEVFLKNIIIFFLILNVVDSKEDVMPIATAIFLGLSEKMIIGFNKIFILKEVTDSGDRMTGVGMVENANDIAAILILAIPFTIIFFKYIKNRAVRILLTLLVFAFYFVIIWQSKSRGATLGLGAFLLMWFWLELKNKKIATTLVVIGLVGAMGLLSAIKRDSTDTANSTSNRIIYWKSGINMAVRNPLFGVGYEQFQNNLIRYVNGDIGSEGTKKTIHSTWLLALAETGFVGFFMYIAIWLIALYKAWKMKYNAPEYLLAILSYGTAITFLSHTYMLYPYILLAITFAAAPYLKDRQEIK